MPEQTLRKGVAQRRAGDGLEAEVFADGGEDVLAGDGGASEVVEAQADVLVAVAVGSAAGGPAGSAVGSAGRDGPSCGPRGSPPLDPHQRPVGGRVAFLLTSQHGDSCQFCAHGRRILGDFFHSILESSNRVKQHLYLHGK